MDGTPTRSCKNWQKFWRHAGMKWMEPACQHPNGRYTSSGKELVHRASTRKSGLSWHLSASGTWESTWTNSWSSHVRSLQLPYGQTLSCDPPLPGRWSWLSTLSWGRNVWRQPSREGEVHRAVCRMQRSRLEDMFLPSRGRLKRLHWKIHPLIREGSLHYQVQTEGGTQGTVWGGGAREFLAFAQKERCKVRQYLRVSSREWQGDTLLLPHHFERLWDQRSETSVKGGPQLMTLQLTPWHGQWCDRQGCPAGREYLCFQLSVNNHLLLQSYPVLMSFSYTVLHSYLSCYIAFNGSRWPCRYQNDPCKTF